MAEAARVLRVVMTSQARAAMSHPAFCGISGLNLSELAAELGPRWEARCESGRHERREGVRLREAGAGPKCGLVFVDRLLVTLVHLRTGLTYEALGVIYEVGSSTISRAICEVRPLLAARGFAIPDRPGVRHHRQRRAGPHPVVGSRTAGPNARPDRGAHRGHHRAFRQHPAVNAVVDDGYRGLANEFPGQVSAPPPQAEGPRRRHRAADRTVWLARAQTPPVLPTHLRGARQRRTPPVAPAPAVHPTP